MDELTEEQLHNLGILLKKLTPEQYDALVTSAKPHVTKLEEEISRIQYGEIELKMTVRAGVIERMDFIERKQWMRQKDI